MMKSRVWPRSLKTRPLIKVVAATITLGGLFSYPRLATATEISEALAEKILTTQVQTVDRFNGGPPDANPTNGGFGAYSAAQTVSPNWTGFSHAFLNRDFSRRDVSFPARGMNHLIGQSRVIYINAETHRLLGVEDSRFLQVTQQAADFLIDTAWDETYGGWYWGIEPSGANPPLDNSYVYGPRAQEKDAYGQVHATLSLAKAYAVTGDTRHLEAALRGWEHFKQQHADTDIGSYTPSFNRDYTQHVAANVGGTRSLEYMLHAFETAIALVEVVEDNASLRQDAQDIGQHIVSKMVLPDPNSWDGQQYERAYSPWFYTATWDSMRIQPGSLTFNYVSPGHQFELALFLSRAVEQGIGDRSWLITAEKLLGHGLFYGYDTMQGTVNYDQFLLAGDPYGSGTVVTWWPQAETARALAHFAVVRDRTDLWDEFELTLATIQTHLTDPVHGGWFATLSPETLAPIEPEGFKGQPWKVYYHGTMLNAELIRLSQLDGQLEGQLD